MVPRLLARRRADEHESLGGMGVAQKVRDFCTEEGIRGRKPPRMWEGRERKESRGVGEADPEGILDSPPLFSSPTIKSPNYNIAPI